MRSGVRFEQDTPFRYPTRKPGGAFGLIHAYCFLVLPCFGSQRTLDLARFSLTAGTPAYSGPFGQNAAN